MKKPNGHPDSPCSHFVSQSPSSTPILRLHTGRENSKFSSGKWGSSTKDPKKIYPRETARRKGSWMAYTKGREINGLLAILAPRSIRCKFVWGSLSFIKSILKFTIISSRRGKRIMPGYRRMPRTCFTFFSILAVFYHGDLDIMVHGYSSVRNGVYPTLRSPPQALTCT